jgi:putative ABC transport system permease protein
MSTVASIQWSDLLPLALESIRHHRLRSTLTIGAVALGIAVMVYLVTLGFGMENMTLGEVAHSNALLSMTVTSQIDKLPLDAKALDKIKKIDGVRDVLPKLSLRGKATITSTNQVTAVTIVGVDPEYLPLIENSKMVVGSVFRAQDKGVMVVTTGFLDTYKFTETRVPQVQYQISFDEDTEHPFALPVMSDVSIYGVINTTGTAVYVPREYLEKHISNQFASYDDAKVRVTSLDKLESVRTEINKLGFRVDTVAETMDQIKKVFFWIRLLLAALGFVAVIVASIGMFNTLTVSLLERTREIGIMKSLGVKKVDIYRLFLLEAVLMGFFGGVAGITLAYVLQQLTIFILSLLANDSPQGKVPDHLFLNHWYIIGGAMLFAITIAFLTGVYPARRAMRLKIIDAIRYE